MGGLARDDALRETATVLVLGLSRLVQRARGEAGRGQPG